MTDEAIIRAALDRVTESYLLRNGVAVATTRRADALAALDRLTAELDRLTASTTSDAPVPGASGTAAAPHGSCMVCGYDRPWTVFLASGEAGVCDQCYQRATGPTPRTSPEEGRNV